MMSIIFFYFTADFNLIDTCPAARPRKCHMHDTPTARRLRRQERHADRRQPKRDIATSPGAGTRSMPLHTRGIDFIDGQLGEADILSMPGARFQPSGLVSG